MFSVQNVAAQKTMEKGVTIIELTQTDGEINVQELNLAPGKYQFKVLNSDVDHEVGFVIQAKKDAKGDVMKTFIPNSFTTETVKKGTHAYTGVVELAAGEYVYSCPLNPTPQYSITVK